tara:strand:- start:765 stop:1508 length:744 start_codon:yes stop_codon:yes gene_type:complete
MQKPTRSRRHSVLISIEGNIGSGKSTLLRTLRERFNSSDTVCFLDEPVEEWNSIIDAGGNTMIQKFYKDQEKYSFSFQMMAYISRLAEMKKYIDSYEYECAHVQDIDPKTRVFITERCLETDRHVFAKMLYDTGKIEDVNYQIYLKWFDTFADIYEPDVVVYLNADANTCFERVKNRSREGEECIPIDYLQSCCDYHDSMIETFRERKTTEIVELDGNQNHSENPQVLVNWVNRFRTVMSQCIMNTA